jgi:lysozyme
MRTSFVHGEIMKKINSFGLSIIKSFEGLEITAYKCPAGIWTIGYGHTKGVCQGDTCTEEEADLFLREDVKVAEDAVNRHVTFPISENQFSSLVSFVFNIGGGNFARSTLLKVINAGMLDSAPEQFERWSRVNGLKIDGLARRRAAEIALWKKPDEANA